MSEKRWSVGDRVLLVAGIVACLSTRLSYAQERDVERRTARSTAYIEIGGAGVLYSINFDHLIASTTSGRIGFAAFGIDDVGAVAVPATASRLLSFGGEGNYAEVGAGPTLVIDEDGAEIIGTIILGIRHQPLHRDFFFRMALTPIIENSDIDILRPGIALGYTF